MVNICENYSYVWKFKLNPSKSIQLNFGGHPQNKDIILNNSLIPVQTSAKHVGVLLNSKLNSVERTMQACRTFRSSALGLMKSGLHSSVASVELCSRVVRQVCFPKAFLDPNYGPAFLILKYYFSNVHSDLSANPSKDYLD